jgi:hypothetical protein
MAVKYVKDFEFPSDRGFSGSAGKTTVKGYMRGGHVKAPRTPKYAEGGSVDTGVMPANKGRTQQEIEAGGTKALKPGYKKGGMKKAHGGVVKKATGGSVDADLAYSDAAANISNASDHIKAAKATKDPKRRAELMGTARAENDRGMESNEKFKGTLKGSTGESVKPAGKYGIGNGAASRAGGALSDYNDRQQKALKDAGVVTRAKGGSVKGRMLGKKAC